MMTKSYFENEMSIKNTNDTEMSIENINEIEMNNNVMRKKSKNIKFYFPEIKKFIIMDLNIEVAFDDLKMDFSILLNTSFFAKKLVFYVYNQEKKELIIDPRKSLEVMLIDDILKSSNESNGSQKGPIEITVRIEQEGA